MAQARSSSGGLDESRRLQLLLRNYKTNRREGSLAAALVQSMALAVISTAGAYPSWVLVTSSQWQVVLGASWAITQADPPRDSPLLGPTGGCLMMAIAACCLVSVVTGSSAIAWDFLGRRQFRALGPMLHSLTALLITCSAALGSSLLGLVRGRTRLVPELQALRLNATPGQSLFLSFLACALAATATGLSCSSPALVAPARSSRDLGRPRAASQSDSEVSSAAAAAPRRGCVSWPYPNDDRFFDFDSSSSQDEDGPPPRRQGWRDDDDLGRAAAEAPQKERVWWRRPAAPQAQPQDDPGRGDAAELQLSSAPEPQRAKSVEKRPSQTSVEGQGGKKQGSPTAAALGD